MSSKLTQTQLGEEFGISSIYMGKKLVELNLKDEKSKKVTKYAFDNKLGKNVTYIKGGKEISIAIWNENTIEYIKKKYFENPDFCAQILIGKLKNLKTIEDSDTGQKIDQIKFDFAYDDFLEIWKKFNSNIKVLSIFVEQLEKVKLMHFAERFEEIKNLKVTTEKYKLESQLTKDMGSTNNIIKI